MQHLRPAIQVSSLTDLPWKGLKSGVGSFSPENNEFHFTKQGETNGISRAAIAKNNFLSDSP